MSVKGSAAITLWSLPKATFAGVPAILAAIELSGNVKCFLELQGALVLANVVFGVAATGYQHKWDLGGVFWDMIKNGMLMVLGGFVYAITSRGLIPAIEAGSPAGDWFATGVVFILILQMLKYMQAMNIGFGPLTPFIKGLSARGEAPAPFPVQQAGNLAEPGSLLDKP